MTVYIGVTGLPACGKEIVKDFLLEVLNEKNISVYHWSMSNDVRREAELTVGSYTRETLTATSKRLKEELGPAAMAIRTIQFLNNQTAELPEVIIMEAIKNSHEVEYFRKNLGEAFILLGVDAPVELLIDRIMSRKRYDEDKSVLLNRSATKELIDRERGTPHSKTGFDIGYCLSIANHIIDNDGDLNDLRMKVENFVDTKIVPRKNIK